jgi:GT2 family glycosyltransferase
MPNKLLNNIGNPVNTFVLPFVFTDKVVDAVKSIWRCHSPAEHRLFLIDNSTDDFPDKKWLEENSHLYIKSYRNLGPAVAFNLGIKIAKTKYITILSDDARLIHQSWFTQATNQLLDEDMIISLGQLFPQKCNPKEDFYNSDKQYSAQDYMDLHQKYASSFVGFNLATAIAKKEVWIKSGLFNEAKYIYWIDGTFAHDAYHKHNIKTITIGLVFHYGDASHKGRLVEENKFHDVKPLNDNEATI